MEKEEIVKYMLQSPEMGQTLRVTSILNVLSRTMRQKGWFTEQEFNDMVENDLKNIAEVAVDMMTKEARDTLEARIKLSKILRKEE